MLYYRDGNPANGRVAEGLRTHQSVNVLWWRHNLAARPSFIREMKLGTPRPQPLAEDNFVVLTTSGGTVTHGHGHWTSYSAVSRAELAKAHPRCAACQGTGIQTLSHFESRTDFVCSCTGGRSYSRVHLGTLREVKLDRYHVVVITADRGWDWLRLPRPGEYEEVEAELIGRYTSLEAAEAEAEKRRREFRFQPGSRYYHGRGPVVGIRVVERPLPEWA